MYRILLILFLLLSNSFSFDIEKFNKELTQLSSNPVYNLDSRELLRIVKPLLDRNKNIKAITIKESLDDQILLSCFRDKDKLIFNKTFPKDVIKFLKYKSTINYQNDVIGDIVLFYEEVEENKFDLLKLTKEEQDWIKNHPIINVGGEMDWAPFDFVDETGDYSGLSKDYLDLVAKISGFKVKYHTGKTWDELLNDLKSGELDMLPALYMNEERKKYTNYTNSYLSLAEYFFTKSDYKKINNITELEGKTLALVKGYTVVSWVKKNYPKIKVIEKPNILECLKSVKSGESISFIGDNASTTYNMEKNFITGIKLNEVVEQRKPIKLYMGTKKEYKILANIINKAIKSITKKQK
ncbi:MAG: transporter substrate-binding domain-containing protein, partial [Arcobacteraceae bacterium]|nr:transporter substrate-binding domain-containing protein [Arcobacteraceae bacterium]